MAEEQKLTKKEKYELRRQEKELQGVKEASNKKKKLITKIVVVLIVIGTIFGVTFLIKKQPSVDSTDILSRKGLHWHPELSIYIKGEKQTIPTDVGIGAVHQPIHTHDDTGTIHLEMTGVVRKEDTVLRKFFEIWEKQFNSNCIFENCNGENGTVKFFVNEKQSYEFENYKMKDGDKIEIRFE